MCWFPDSKEEIVFTARYQTIPIENVVQFLSKRRFLLQLLFGSSSRGNVLALVQIIQRAGNSRQQLSHSHHEQISTRSSLQHNIIFATIRKIVIIKKCTSVFTPQTGIKQNHIYNHLFDMHELRATHSLNLILYSFVMCR